MNIFELNVESVSYRSRLINSRLDVWLFMSFTSSTSRLRLVSSKTKSPGESANNKSGLSSIALFNKVALS